MQSKEKISLLIFMLAGIGNLIAVLLGSSLLNYITKPLLLLPILIAWGMITGLNTSFAKRIAGAFLFSWFGDLLLMLVGSSWGQKIPFFILGLVGFLIAHLFFISAFWQYKGKQKGLVQQKPWLILPFVLYWALLMFQLWPGLGDLQIPVLAYSLVIITMCLSATNLLNSLSGFFGKLLVLGTGLFVLSDSLIAVNKFGSPFPAASFAIMLTYILAQFLIYWSARFMYQETKRPQ